MDNLSFDAKES